MTKITNIQELKLMCSGTVIDTLYHFLLLLQLTTIITNINIINECIVGCEYLMYEQFDYFMHQLVMLFGIAHLQVGFAYNVQLLLLGFQLMIVGYRLLVLFLYAHVFACLLYYLLLFVVSYLLLLYDIRICIYTIPNIHI